MTNIGDRYKIHNRPNAFSKNKQKKLMNAQIMVQKILSKS